jgi:hypothetical protein
MARDYFNNSGEQFDRMMAGCCPVSRAETLRRMAESISASMPALTEWEAKRAHLAYFKANGVVAASKVPSGRKLAAPAPRRSKTER